MQMASGESKLRIVWICHFMNDNIRKVLGIKKKIKEYAPWITLGIEEVKKRDDIELHVIFPNSLIRRDMDFDDCNIHYHCIKTGIPLLKRRWPKKLRFDAFTNYYFFNLKVNRKVNRIKPDLINLHGAENAYYSSSIFNLLSYPTLITIQGFITLNNADNIGGIEVKRRLEVEKRILRMAKNFTIEATFMGEYIKGFNPDARMFWVHCPFAKTSVVANGFKEYDLVFYAKICQMKGVEDLIKALSELKLWKHDITLIIMGSGDPGYIEYIKVIINELNLSSNIIFKGFVPTQKEMHQEAAKARISVLPTYNDTIPGTIAESMLMGIPVISYKTGGIPDLNIKGENVIIVEQGDVNRLALEIRALLDDPAKQDELSRRSREYALEEFDNSNSINKLIQAYRTILSEV